jgi:hypothetical protein
MRSMVGGIRRRPPPARCTRHLPHTRGGAIQRRSVADGHIATITCYLDPLGADRAQKLPENFPQNQVEQEPVGRTIMSAAADRP